MTKKSSVEMLKLVEICSLLGMTPRAFCSKAEDGDVWIYLTDVQIHWVGTAAPVRFDGAVLPVAVSDHVRSMLPRGFPIPNVVRDAAAGEASLGDGAVEDETGRRGRIVDDRGLPVSHRISGSDLRIGRATYARLAAQHAWPLPTVRQHAPDPDSASAAKSLEVLGIACADANTNLTNMAKYITTHAPHALLPMPDPAVTTTVPSTIEGCVEHILAVCNASLYIYRVGTDLLGSTKGIPRPLMYADQLADPRGHITSLANLVANVMTKRGHAKGNSAANLRLHFGRVLAPRRSGH